MANLVDRIKNQIRKTGTNKSKIMYFKEGEKYRIRFLQDMNDGMVIPFHDSFSEGINVPCQEYFGRECKYCENDELRTRDFYIWSVWDYEAKEVKLFMFPVNNCSPLPNLVGFYETYGNIIDRDYVITRQGKSTNTTYSVVPMDRSKFKNEKAKPFSEEKVLEILDKAFPVDDVSDKNKKKRRDEEIEDEVINDEEEMEMEEENNDEIDYKSMSAKELYKLCKERDIDVKPKQSKEYYIEKLEAADNKNEIEDEDDWDDDDEW